MGGRFRRRGAHARRPRPPRGRTANRALGYQQVLAFLAGELTEAEAKERTISGTRRFARRQDSWFRKDPRIAWLDYDDPERVERALRQLG